MELILKITSGPLAGRSYPLRAGAVIGRADTEIPINDAKMSGRHAKVETNKEGQLQLVDLGSTNGIRVGGKRSNAVVLSPGLIFQLGSTEFRVEAPSQSVSALDDDLTMAPTHIAAKKSHPAAQFFATLCGELIEKTPNQPEQLYPFEPMLELHVVRGPQAGTTWPLGYGPRAFGSSVLEFHLFDENVPPTAFVISPTPGGGAQFHTDFPNRIQLNGLPVKSDTLKSGDLISFENTEIEVSFIK